MIDTSSIPKDTLLAQMVDAALDSFVVPRYEQTLERRSTIPAELQDLVCQPGLVLLSGRPAMGCTSLALNTVLSTTKTQQKTAVYFSFDSTKERLMKKLLCIEGMVNTRRIWDRKLTDADWGHLKAAGKLIKELPLYIYDDPLLKVSEISQICRQHEHIDLVIVDSLQNIQSIPGEWGTTKRTKKENCILQQLKRLSTEHNTCVLCLNTLGHDVEMRVCKQPDVCDIKKYQTSFDYIDTALFLYREDYYEAKTPGNLHAYCYVRLGRNNDYSRIRMNWIPEYTVFLDIPLRNTNHPRLCDDITAIL